MQERRVRESRIKQEKNGCQRPARGGRESLIEGSKHQSQRIIGFSSAVNSRKYVITATTKWGLFYCVKVLFRCETSAILIDESPAAIVPS
jgi:hypothetical protein